SGDVRHDKITLCLNIDHAEVRDEGGEGIVGDFGFGGRDGGDQGGFPDIGKAEQPHIRQEFQFQFDLSDFSRFAFLRKLRSLVDRVDKVDITASADTASGN